MMPMKSPDPRALGPNYTSYVLVMLGITSFFNYLDRSVFSVLAVSIKADLELSDTQIGLLGGFGFALFYAVLGIPIARLSDKRSRMPILSICLGVWSAATALCGVASSFIQLLWARVGVGAGESGCAPASYSILADYFPAQRRAFAVGMFHTGGNIGFLCGLMLAGILAEAVGWRATFFVLGVPGVLFAIALKMTVREPIRGAMDVAVKPGISPSVPTIWRLIKERPAYVHLTAGYTTASFGFYSALNWLPHIFKRSHGMTSAEIGIQYGIAFGGGMVIGVALGAILAPRMIARDRRWEMWFPALVTVFCVPAFLGVLASGEKNSALIFTFFGCAFFSMGIGPGLASMQSLTEAAIRATASAIVLLIAALLGQGLGPTFVGISSDALADVFGEHSLRLSLVFSQLTYGWAALHFYLGGRRFLKDAVC